MNMDVFEKFAQLGAEDREKVMRVINHFLFPTFSPSVNRADDTSDDAGQANAHE